MNAEECSNERCIQLSDRAAGRFRRPLGIKTYRLEPSWGGLGEVNFPDTLGGQEHYEHIRERVEGFVGRIVELEIDSSIPPKIRLVFKPEIES